MSTERRDPVARRARRVLTALLVAVTALIGALGAGVTFSDASWSPRLGLDLEGGTQFVLRPVTEGGQGVSSEQLEQARDIIVQRIDSQGTSGAEVTTQGDENIVVAMAGRPSAEQEDAIRASSQMQFRPVLATFVGSPQPEPTATESGASEGGEPESSGEGSSESPSASPGSSSPTSASRDRARVAPAEQSSPPQSEGSEPAESASSSATPTEGEEGAGDSATSSAPQGGQAGADPFGWEPSGEPTSPTDPNNISKETYEKFVELDCSAQSSQVPDTDPDEAITACSEDGSLKYLLGPQVVAGSSITDAAAGYQTTPQGQITNTPEISLSFDSEATKTYSEVSSELVALPNLGQTPANPPSSYNALATVLDGTVLVAPGFREAIPNGTASITGSFTIEEARALAQSLKFGALPLSFEVQSKADISPTLGSEQLRIGIIAGIVGLLLVIGYSIFQYRALALVTIGSMTVAFGLTYLAIALLSWGYNYRLDMAGVTGLIIAIGVTADSFIVYFERVRDELREGRNLRAAVEAGWERAKRTILVADGVNFIAAAVLYVLASSGVRGFAFTLGLTTLIDLAVFWFFTHPLLTLLARRKFFASGSPWSGFEVETLQQAGVRYRGRAQFDLPSERKPRAGVTSDGGAVL